MRSAIAAFVPPNLMPAALGFFFQRRRAKGGGELHLGRRHFDEPRRSESGRDGLHRLAEQMCPNAAIATAVKGLSVDEAAKKAELRPGEILIHSWVIALRPPGRYR